MRLQLLWVMVGVGLVGCEGCFQPIPVCGSGTCDTGGGGGAMTGGGSNGGGGGEALGGGTGGSGGGAVGGGGGAVGGGGQLGGGTGGGDADGGMRAIPDIEVTPAPTLDLGRVAYFAGSANPGFAYGTFTIRNVGTRPSPADPSQNLKLGPPYWSVSPLIGNASEICVGEFDEQTHTCTGGVSGYDPAIGLVADGMSALTVPVRIIPDGLGLRRFAVTIYSNDPDEPTTVITISANAVALPPCDLEVTPISLDFGVLMPPASTELAMSIRNRLTGPNDVCVVSNLRVVQNVSVFSLPGSPTSLDLQPDERRVVKVRATPGLTPPTQMNVTGALAFSVADPVNPQRVLPLTATLIKPCITIAPGKLDFHTVAQGCGSTTQTVQVTNVCGPNQVTTISSTTVRDPGEFTVLNGIASGTRIPWGSSPTNTLSFDVAYRPTNSGLDHNALILSVVQEGVPLNYVLPLSGQADSQGLNTDTMQVGSGKVDVLMVIDNSGSMADKQMQLGIHMPASLQYAAITGTDFHLGVIDTEMTASNAIGYLHKTNRGTKILTASTPNLATQFAELANVGTSGYNESCPETALAALTWPNISDPAINGGFLRDDASLSIICVTDANAQTFSPPTYYLDQFWNVKPRSRFNYNVMGPFLPMAPSGCTYDSVGSDGRHEAMANLSGGVLEEICTTDWPTALVHLGTSAFINVGSGSTMYLGARPDLSSSMGIVVKIDGITVPEFSPQPPNARLWTYDVTKNVVTFEAIARPPPNSTVSVSYVAICVP